MKAKRILSLFLLIAAASGITGCSIKIDNMTPMKVPANPSGIYTLSARPLVTNDMVDPSSISMYIVIDGEKHPMTPSSISSEYYDYEYELPAGQKDALFYYEMHYRMRNFGNQQNPLKIKKSEPKKLQLVDRYSITLDVERAPIGTKIAMLGRGFRQGDRIFVGGTAANTRFLSSNVLEFTVPNVEPGNSYAVEVHGNKDVQSAGMLRVDPGNPLSVLPQSVGLLEGQRQALAFVLEYPAPAGGLEILVTTDIPDSVIMPEVFIPEGARTVNIPVMGDTAARGTLYVKGNGLPELEIPISIR